MSLIIMSKSTSNDQCKADSVSVSWRQPVEITPDFPCGNLVTCTKLCTLFHRISHSLLSLRGKHGWGKKNMEPPGISIGFIHFILELVAPAKPTVLKLNVTRFSWLKSWEELFGGTTRWEKKYILMEKKSAWWLKIEAVGYYRCEEEWGRFFVW